MQSWFRGEDLAPSRVIGQRASITSSYDPAEDRHLIPRWGRSCELAVRDHLVTKLQPPGITKMKCTRNLRCRGVFVLSSLNSNLSCQVSEVEKSTREYQTVLVRNALCRVHAVSNLESVASHSHLFLLCSFLPFLLAVLVNIAVRHHGNIEIQRIQF
ncbi:hypothetical protein SCHPADRAFT_680066 [Schizopora paradoxa]|uniref:Uncharacterized protein n=1 Tax=Schizopora paradoxa TaxID=27342 RepID=A0A0H2RB70_9AGAM|nr:hypothetical protein SCHPADRAFT_680066 [Schizopora paradoxa]